MQKILKKQFVQIEDALAALPARSRGGAARACEKSVQLLRVEGSVRALEITCSCGEKTVVELDYAKAKEPA